MPALPAAVSQTDRICLSHLFRGLMEHGEARGVKSFPALNSNLWDKLLYDLKERYPTEFGRFVFEWDGPVPVSRDVDDVMFGLQFMCLERRGDERISLQPDAIRVQNSTFFSVPQNFEEIIGAAFDIASGIEGFLER